MKVYIVSEQHPAALRAREVILGEGLDCPAAHMLSLALAREHLEKASPDLVLVVLPPRPDESLAVLANLRGVVSAPVIALGPTDDARLVLAAMRAGATDYIDEAVVETDLPAAVKRRRVERRDPAHQARVIAVLAPNGGSGSSTVAANVATVLARAHGSVLLFDLKLHSGDLAALLDLKPTHTIAELCQNAARMDRTMLERSLTRHPSGVQLLAPPAELADVALVSADGVRRALKLGATLFPYIVLDLDHSFAPEQTEALRHADVVLLVLRLDFASLRNTQRTLDYLERMGVSRDRVQLVANRYGQAKELPAAKAIEALGLPITHFIPEDPRTVNRAGNNGVPVVLEDPRSRVSRSLVQVAESVNGRHP